MNQVPGKTSVLLTRPRRESRLAARELAAEGFDSIHMPLQSTRRAPRTAALLADLSWASGASMQIFVSRAAVVAALASAPAQVAAAGICIAVGRNTAAALQSRGIEAITAPGHAQDSDGVLGLPQLQEVRGKKVVIWAAPGGRDRIAAVLGDRGAELRVIAVYQRLAQRPRAFALKRLREAGDRIVLSATSAALLQALDLTLQRHRLTALRSRPLIVASERIAERSRALGFMHVCIAAGASAAALIAALRASASPLDTIGCALGDDPLPSLRTKS